MGDYSADLQQIDWGRRIAYFIDKSEGTLREAADSSAGMTNFRKFLNYWAYSSSFVRELSPGRPADGGVVELTYPQFFHKYGSPHTSFLKTCGAIGVGLIVIGGTLTNLISFPILLSAKGTQPAFRHVSNAGMNAMLEACKLSPECPTWVMNLVDDGKTFFDESRFACLTATGDGPDLISMWYPTGVQVKFPKEWERVSAGNFGMGITATIGIFVGSAVVYAICSKLPSFESSLHKMKLERRLAESVNLERDAVAQSQELRVEARQIIADLESMRKNGYGRGETAKLPGLLLAAGVKLGIIALYFAQLFPWSELFSAVAGLDFNRVGDGKEFDFNEWAHDHSINSDDCGLGRAGIGVTGEYGNWDLNNPNNTVYFGEFVTESIPGKYQDRMDDLVFYQAMSILFTFSLLFGPHILKEGYYALRYLMSVMGSCQTRKEASHVEIEMEEIEIKIEE